MRARLEQDVVEACLCGIWGEVLGCERPRPDDDFFALGGTSLGAVQLAARANAAFGVEVAANAVFTARTPAAYTAVVLEGSRERGGVRPQRVDRDALSAWEATVWSWGRYGSGLEAHTVDVFMLDGPLDVPALERAVSALVLRHEILRTVYPEVGYRPRARVLPAEPYRIAVTDLTSGARWRREQAIRDALRQLGSEPLDYRVEPPLRVRLLRLGSQRHVLVIAVHEIICDGESYPTLLNDLSELYNSRADAATRPLQYRDAIRLGPHADAAAGDRYWERIYGEVPLTLPLPFGSGGRVSATLPAARTERATAVLAQDVVRALGALAVQEAATPFMAYGAAYALLLHRWTGDHEIVIETSAANRARPQLQGVIGMFARTLPLHVDVADGPSFRALLRRMRDAALTAFHYADQMPVIDPIWLLTGATGLLGRPPHLSLREPGREPQLRLARIAVRRPEDDDERTGSLRCELRVAPDATKLAISSNATGWAPGELPQLTARFGELLTAAVSDPEQPIGVLASRRPAPCARATSAWPGRGASRLDELVDRQARRDPLAAAVSDAAQSLAYGTLMVRAEELAERLRAAGVGAGRTVGVPLEPSADAIVTALAVLKAGATCIPEAVEAGARAPAPAPDGAAAEDVAFLLPTAGVTGPSRWIALRHEQLVRHAEWQCSSFGLGPGDAAFHSPGPGVRTWLLTPWPYLAVGARVVVPRAMSPGAVGVERPPAKPPAITVAGLTPYEASRWLAAPQAQRPCLRLVRVQGHGALAMPHAQATRDISVVREYCASEAGGTVLVEPARASAGAWAGVAGTPTDLGVPIVVVDRHGNAAADHAIGELAVGEGPTVVRTGDLGRRRADGTIEFLGRLADEVRFRGFRLNPVLHLIEDAVASHPAVAAAVAVWDPEAAAVVAATVPQRGELPSKYTLDRWIRTHAPDWVLPARYVEVDAIPRRADGSPDRDALAVVTRTSHEVRCGPGTPTERTLLRIWRKVLGRRRIGVHENFFALGGNLLLGIEVSSRAREAGIGFEPNVLLCMPTIAALATIVDGERREADGRGLLDRAERL